jgi:hypothetical protein
VKVYKFWAEPRSDADRQMLRHQLAVAATYRRDLAHIENRARRLLRAIMLLPKDQQAPHRATLTDGQKAANYAARTRAREAGCSWGTCGRVDDALDQSRRTTAIQDDVSTFASRDEGLLAVQYQRHLLPPMCKARNLPCPRCGGHDAHKRLSVVKWRPVLASSLIGGDDSYVRISADLVGRPTLRARRSDAGGTGAEHLRVLSFRVGSDGRDPIFAALYTAMDGHGRGVKARERGLHPLPDARVVWVCLSCITTGLRQRWELIVSVDEECRGEPDSVRAACVGIDIGWRRVDGGIRTAYWAGSDGESGELVIPDEVVDRKGKSDSLLSIRDREQNEVAAEWRAWVMALPADHPVRVEGVARAMHMWKRVGRYVSLSRLWERHRVDGDDEMFARVQRWLAHDRHLLAWQTHNRRRLSHQVADRVDQLMIQLARKYEVVAVERRGMVPQLVRRDATEDGEHALEVARKRIGVVAPGSVRMAAEQWSRKYGAIFRELDPADTTASCASCGDEMEGDRAQIELRCPRCGTIDQDRNAALNLQRRASAAVGRELAEALAPRSSSATPKKLPSRRTRRRVIPGPLETAHVTDGQDS